LATNYRNIGLVYEYERKYDDALTYYNKTLEICKNLNDRVKLVRIYGDIGYAHLNNNNRDKAKEPADNVLVVANEFKKDTGTEYPFISDIDRLLKSINEY
jgi:tetratricopeptide (TPR) repeat protein